MAQDAMELKNYREADKGFGFLILLEKCLFLAIGFTLYGGNW
jgi:hypothetical protein